MPAPPSSSEQAEGDPPPAATESRSPEPFIPPPVAAGAPAERVPLATPVVNERQLQREKEEKFERLRQQIEKLDQRWKRELASPPPETSAPLPATPPPAATTPAPSEIPSIPETSQIAAPDSDVPALPATDSTTPPPLPFPGSTEDRSEELPAPGLVIDGPVDRLGLADSLFATGEVPIALEMYAQLDVETYPPDTRLWIAFQTASCHRRLGNASEAEKQYRQILAKHQTGWIPDLCRWWLASMQDRARLTANSQKLSQILNTLQTQLDNELPRKP